MGDDDKSDYQAQVKQLYADIGIAQALEFDRRLMWISAGGLALILAYIPALRTPPALAAEIVLMVGAVSLASALILTLWSFQWGVQIAETVLAACEDKDCDAEMLRKSLVKKAYRRNKIHLAVMAFGILCLLIFAGWTFMGGY
jgi:hypothetical protein